MYGFLRASYLRCELDLFSGLVVGRLTTKCWYRKAVVLKCRCQSRTPGCDRPCSVVIPDKHVLYRNVIKLNTIFPPSNLQQENKKNSVDSLKMSSGPHLDNHCLYRVVKWIASSVGPGLFFCI